MEKLIKCLFCKAELVNDCKKREELVKSLMMERTIIDKVAPELEDAILSMPASFHVWCGNKNCDYLFFGRAYNDHIADETNITYMYILAQFGQYVVKLFHPNTLKEGNAFVYAGSLLNEKFLKSIIEEEREHILKFVCSEFQFLNFTEDGIGKLFFN